jgi:(S)-citramalyl-CoA lyase
MPMSTLLHNQLRACRSFLLTPGSRPEGFPAARAAGGDAIIVDLESTVAPADKGRAREAALAFLRQPPVPDFVRLVRLNSPHLGDFSK